MGLESEYANRKTLYVLPPAGYDTQESNVPVMVRIGRSSGKYRDDTSDVFEKLGASYQKMAVSLDDGVTECPVEVTEWDVKRQLGILFVKIPSVPTTGMTLKLWYDPTHADNTNVGVIGSAVGQSVWANGFEGVWHMKNSGGLVLDSTANANHGTIHGATETDGPLGRCLSFDGADDYAEVADDDVLDFDDSGAFTATVMCHPRSYPARDWADILSKGDYDNYGISIHWDHRIRNTVATTGGSISPAPPGDYVESDHMLSITAVSEGALVSYDNGVAIYQANLRPGAFKNTAHPLRFGYDKASNYYDGTISYATISSVARSPAWIALTHASLKDELIAFSTPGTESLTGNERMRLTSDGKLIADEFVEV